MDLSELSIKMEHSQGLSFLPYSSSSHPWSRELRFIWTRLSFWINHISSSIRESSGVFTVNFTRICSQKFWMTMDLLSFSYVNGRISRSASLSMPASQIATLPLSLRMTYLYVKWFLLGERGSLNFQWWSSCHCSFTGSFQEPSSGIEPITPRICPNLVSYRISKFKR